MKKSLDTLTKNQKRHLANARTVLRVLVQDGIVFNQHSYKTYLDLQYVEKSLELAGVGYNE